MIALVGGVICTKSIAVHGVKFSSVRVRQIMARVFISDSLLVVGALSTGHHITEQELSHHRNEGNLLVLL